MKSGFTLIELLLSVAIIAVLVAGSVMILRPADYFARTRDSRRISDLKVIQTALEQYYANNNSYPEAAADVPSFGGAWTASDGITYLRMTPSDPSGLTEYCYSYSSPNYEICAAIEKSSGAASVYGCGATYNYCLTNPF